MSIQKIKVIVSRFYLFSCLPNFSKKILNKSKTFIIYLLKTFSACMITKHWVCIYFSIRYILKSRIKKQKKFLSEVNLLATLSGTGCLVTSVVVWREKGKKKKIKFKRKRKNSRVRVVWCSSGSRIYQSRYDLQKYF